MRSYQPLVAEIKNRPELPSSPCPPRTTGSPAVPVGGRRALGGAALAPPRVQAGRPPTHSDAWSKDARSAGGRRRDPEVAPKETGAPAGRGVSGVRAPGEGPGGGRERTEPGTGGAEGRSPRDGEGAAGAGAPARPGRGAYRGRGGSRTPLPRLLCPPSLALRSPAPPSVALRLWAAAAPSVSGPFAVSPRLAPWTRPRGGGTGTGGAGEEGRGEWAVSGGTAGAGVRRSRRRRGGGRRTARGRRDSHPPAVPVPAPGPCRGRGAGGPRPPSERLSSTRNEERSRA